MNDQATIEASIGLQLPKDYWDFAKTYGSGKIMTSNFEIFVYNPFSESYKQGIEWDCEMLSSIEGLEYDIYPTRPGLLSWGGDVNGNTLFWNTHGNPDEWPIVLCPETGLVDDFEKFADSMTSFLTRAIQGSRGCKAWDEAMAFKTRETPEFMSY